MEPHFTSTGGSTAEAERWLGIAEKLLAGRDLIGSKTFAIRAREAEPRLEAADQILAVADTLIAGEKRINNNQPDWYAILQLPLQTRDSGLIATQYRRLAILLNPHRNHLPFADEAFKLVYDAWSVLFDPAKKTIYDSELNFFSKLDSGAAAASRGVPDPLHPLHHYKQPEQPQPPQQQAARESPRNYNFNNEESENPNINEDENNNNNNNNNDDDDDDNPNFWTACPYCYNIYEYQRIYEDCSLRCQNCQRAFHGAKIPVPPSIDQGIEAYFSCWGFFPLGLTKANPPEKNKSGVPNWAPFSPFFTCPQFMVKKPKKSWVIIDEDDVFVDVSESSEESDDEWGSTKKKKKKKAKRMKRKKGLDAKFVRKSQGEKVKNVGGVGGGELQGGPAMQEFVVSPSVSSAGTSRKVGASSVKKQTGKAPKEWGKLDLNVEFSNEVEEAAAGMREGNKAGNGEEDGIEGIGFFEGLDEFLSSLPILKG